MWLALIALLFSANAWAQASSSGPGPYVFDIRATMSGLPSNGNFLPALPTSTLVPKRGFGIGGGAHVYLASLGVARLGVGVDAFRIRGTAATPAILTPVSQTEMLTNASPIDVATTMTAVAPQLSFNFGTREGWSYLSGGYGAASIRSKASGERPEPLNGSVTVERGDGLASAVNYGGGARWFIRERMAVGFDVRLYRVGAVGTRPSTRMFAAALGLSMR